MIALRVLSVVSKGDFHLAMMENIKSKICWAFAARQMLGFWDFLVSIENIGLNHQ